MRYAFPTPRRQTGASLVVVLILLLVMTLLGLAVLRGTLLEERMSANLLDRNQNFQAAEAALRQAEGMIVAGEWGTTPPADGSGCSNGMCSRPDDTSANRATDASFVGWRNATVDVDNGLLGAQPSQPQFFVEYMGWGEVWLLCAKDWLTQPDSQGREDLCLRPVYRITARSEADGRASVLLQSNFIAP